eukprot:1159802-Pelagomonas_calceolata.AAC.2
MPGIENWIIIMLVFHQRSSGMFHAKSVSQVGHQGCYGRCGRRVSGLCSGVGILSSLPRMKKRWKELDTNMTSVPDLIPTCDLGHHLCCPGSVYVKGYEFSCPQVLNPRPELHACAVSSSTRA